MTSSLSKTEDGTITITIDLPWTDIRKAYDGMVARLLQEVEVKGFRKGKAPYDLAVKQLDKNKVYEEVLKDLLPKIYSDAISTHKITPIVSPEIKLIKAKEGEDWQFTAKTCEKPEVKLDNYKEIIAKAKGVIKKDDLWLPGKDKQKEPQKPEETRQRLLNTVLEALYKTIKVPIPTILLQVEVNRRLTRLVDELQKLGLTLDQYIASKGKTGEQIRKEHEDEVAKMYSLEFILEQLADSEKITVEESEIEKMVQSAKSESEKKAISSNRYYLASLIRRQKTLDRLASL